MNCIIFIKGKGGKCFAYHHTSNKKELDRLVKKYISMPGISIEVVKKG